MIVLFPLVSGAQACDTINVADTVYACRNTVTSLSSTISGPNSVLSVVWSPSQGLSSPDSVYTRDTLNTVSGYRYITVESRLPNNLIFNGDFSLGDTGFSSSYTYGASPGPVLYEGHDAVDTDPHNVHSGFASYGDHTSGNGKMLILNGAPSAISFWCQTVSVSPNTTYIFSVWTANCSNTFNSPAQIQLQINGSQVGVIFQPANAFGQWTLYTVNWNSGSSTVANICLYDQNTAAAGNDFTVDDISFYPTCISTDSVYVKVYNLNPTVSPAQSICAGNTLNLTASDTTSGVLYSWTGPGSFNSLSQNPSISNAQASNSGTYTVTVSINGCSVSVNTSATVNPNLGPPAINITVSPGDTICGGTNVTFTANASNATNPVYQWHINGFNTGTNSPNFASNTINNGDVINCKVTSATNCQAVDTNTSNNIMMHLISAAPPTLTLSTYPASYVNGAVVTFTGHPSNSTGLTYKWTKNGITIPGATGSIYTSTNVQAGDVICLIIYSSVPCTYPDSVMKCTTLTTGVSNSQWQANDIKVYPNPTNSVLHVEAPEPVSIDISGIDGKIILHLSNTASVDMSKLANGFYLVFVYNTEGLLIKTEKVVKSSW